MRVIRGSELFESMGKIALGMKEMDECIRQAKIQERRSKLSYPRKVGLAATIWLVRTLNRLAAWIER